MSDFNSVVYVLGAGCSAEDGAPLINDFFEKGFSKLEHVPRAQRIKDFREKYLPGSNIEEFFDYIDFRSSIDSESTDKSIRSDLIYFISKTIEETLPYGQSKIYSQFQKNFIKTVPIKKTFISFNWDILLDNVILKAFIDDGNSTLKLSNGINYCESFRLIETPQTIGDSNGLNPLLKLHGSLNWLFCQSCEIKYFAYGGKIGVVAQENSISCPKCGFAYPLDPIIVPPSFNKYGNIQLLKKVWLKAFLEISRASALFLMGYSFPEGDTMFQTLFRSALSKNKRLRNKPIKINIINYKKYLSDKVEFEHHYKQILDVPGVDIKPTFEYIRFSDFVNKNALDYDLH
ncbi:MAG: hypothetical protein M1530_00960 [Candidatus Marsarchaeota archaeon]|nr:hypothetical protein [Candidatus Marsarchaeota archaeon]